MMTKSSEKERDVEPAGDVSVAAEAARRRPRTRALSEAVVAALSEEPGGLRTRVVSEEVVAAIPATTPTEGESEPGGGADDEAGAGA